ncbi:hypothetical protein ACMFMG_010751 [Clarireedia jacksonii]
MAGSSKRKKSDTAEDKQAKGNPKTSKLEPSNQMTGAAPLTAKNADVSMSIPTVASLLPSFPKRRGRPPKVGSGTPAAAASASAKSTPASVLREPVQKPNPVPSLSSVLSRVEDTNETAQPPTKRARLEGDGGDQRSTTQLSPLVAAAYRQLSVAPRTETDLTAAERIKYQLASNVQSVAADAPKANSIMSVQASQQRIIIDTGKKMVEFTEERFREVQMGIKAKMVGFQSQHQIQNQKVMQAQFVGLQQHQSHVQGGLGGLITPRSNAAHQQIEEVASLTSGSTAQTAQNLPQAVGIYAEERAKLHFDNAAWKRGETMRLSNECMAGNLRSSLVTAHSGSAGGFLDVQGEGDSNISAGGTWGATNGSKSYNHLQNSSPSSSSAQTYQRVPSTTLLSQPPISSQSPMVSHLPVHSNSSNANKNLYINRFSPPRANASPQINTFVPLEHLSPSHPKSPHLSPPVPTQLVPYLSSPTPTRANAPNPRKWATIQRPSSNPLHPPSFIQPTTPRIFNPLLSNFAAPGLHHPNVTSSASTSPAGDNNDSDNIFGLDNTSAFLTKDNINTSSNNTDNTQSATLPPSSTPNLHSTIPIGQSHEQAQHIRNTFTPQQIQQMRKRLQVLYSITNTNTDGTLTSTSTAASTSSSSLVPSLNSSFSSAPSSSVLPEVTAPQTPSSLSSSFPRLRTQTPIPHQDQPQHQSQSPNLDQSQSQNTPKTHRPSIARELITEQINAIQSSDPLTRGADINLERLKVVRRVQDRLEAAWARGARRVNRSVFGMGLDGVRDSNDNSSRQCIIAKVGTWGALARKLPNGRVLALDKLKVVRTPSNPDTNRYRLPGSNGEESRVELQNEAVKQERNNGLKRGICHFCTPGMEFDFGIAEYAPQENTRGFDTGSIKSINIWADPGEEACRSCSSYTTAPSSGNDRINSPLHPRRQNQPPNQKTSSKISAKNILPPKKTLSLIDNKDITAYMPNLQCRCCAWRILDVGKAQICGGCKMVKMGIVAHGRHLEFESSVDRDRGGEGRCMVCIYRAEYRLRFYAVCILRSMMGVMGTLKDLR